jgi:hypothetical protein
MAKALEMLRKFSFKRAEKPVEETVFDLRLKKLGGVRQVAVSRAVLFKTQPRPLEA